MRTKQESNEAHARPTVRESRAAHVRVPGAPAWEDGSLIRRAFTAAEFRIDRLTASARARELRIRLNGYRRVIERWSSVGRPPTTAQSGAMLECADGLRREAECLLEIE